MKISKSTAFECLTHNPLLMFRGCNPIPHEASQNRFGLADKTPYLLPFYQKFQELYAAAIKQTSTKNVVFGLEVDYTDTDEGKGGFWDAGYVPVDLFANRSRGEELDKMFQFYWPRNCQGKFMRFLASINLGPWPRVLHDSLSEHIQYWKGGRSYAVGTNISKEGYDKFVEGDIWMHVFTDSAGDFETFNPDCHIRFTTEFNFSRIDETHAKIIHDIYDNKVLSKEQIREAIVKFQNENTEKDESLNGAKSFFGKITPRFYYDGCGKRTDRLDDLYDKEVGIFEYGKGDCSIFGKPSSQQEERRFISPDRFNGVRALTPMFCFSDSEHDMTHQFYADALMTEDISHKRAYCKLDSSCT